MSMPPSGARPSAAMPPPVGAPPPPMPMARDKKPKRKGLRIFLGVVVGILVVLITLIGFLRQTNTGAARDRDIAKQALLRPEALGEGFKLESGTSYAATNAGLEITLSAQPAKCLDVSATLNESGTGGALERLSDAEGRRVDSEVHFFKAATAAAEILDRAGSQSVVDCLSIAFGVPLTLAANPAKAEREISYTGTFPTGKIVDVVVAQQERAVILLFVDWGPDQRAPEAIAQLMDQTVKVVKEGLQ